MDVEEQRGVLLRLLAQWVVAVHNHQLLAELMDTCTTCSPVCYNLELFFLKSFQFFEDFNGVF